MKRRSPPGQRPGQDIPPPMRHEGQPAAPGECRGAGRRLQARPLRGSACPVSERAPGALLRGRGGVRRTRRRRTTGGERESGDPRDGSERSAHTTSDVPNARRVAYLHDQVGHRRAGTHSPGRAQTRRIAADITDRDVSATREPPFCIVPVKVDLRPVAAHNRHSCAGYDARARGGTDAVVPASSGGFGCSRAG